MFNSIEHVSHIEAILTKTQQIFPIDSTNALEYERFSKELLKLGQIMLTISRQKINEGITVYESNN